MNDEIRYRDIATRYYMALQAIVAVAHIQSDTFKIAKLAITVPLEIKGENSK